jgi:hypothetical protein
MTHLFFHCTAPGEVLVDRRGIIVSDLAEAREHALAIARIVMDGAYGCQDFSEWSVYIGDDEDEELLLVPFAAAMPTRH